MRSGIGAGTKGLRKVQAPCRIRMTKGLLMRSLLWLGSLVLLLPMAAAAQTTGSSYSYDVVRTFSDGTFHRVLSVVLLSDKALIKSSAASRDSCENKGMVVPKNGSVSRSEISGAIRTVATYTISQNNHRIRTEQTFGDSTYVTDIGLEVQGADCRMVHFQYSVDPKDRTKGMRPANSGYVCKTLPLKAFEEPKHSVAGIKC